MHHPKADIDRLICKKERRKRPVTIEATNKTEIINSAEYMNTKYTEDKFVNIV